METNRETPPANIPTNNTANKKLGMAKIPVAGNAASFLFAVLLVVLFAGGSFLDWFPLRGRQASDTLGRDERPQRILDYLWHITLPVLAMVIGGFASLTMLTKNSFLEEIHKHYVITARAKRSQRMVSAVRPCVSQRHAHRRGRI